MRYQGTKKAASAIARELHVDALVEGSVQRSDQRVLITVQLIEASSEHQLWAKSYERDLRDKLALQNEVAQAVGEEIRGKLTPEEQARFAPPRPVNPEAQEALDRATYWRTRGNVRKLFEFTQKATEKDPSFATAWARLGGDYGLMINFGFISPKEGYAKWREAVTTALRLDPNSAAAHDSLGVLLLYLELAGGGKRVSASYPIEPQPSGRTSVVWRLPGGHRPVDRSCCGAQAG
jgi:hypothetical protein